MASSCYLQRVIKRHCSKTTKYLSPLKPMDYSTDLMKSRGNRDTSKSPKSLLRKYRPELPVHRARQIGSREQEVTESGNVLDGNSKLLTRFNQESDIYIPGNTQFVNRKYEPLIEQLEYINTPLDEVDTSEASDHRTPRQNAMEMQEGVEDFNDTMSKLKSENVPRKPLKQHEDWGYFFPNGQTLYSEPETWNVIAHINRRHSYGKSLRYSDRFYRNWAISIAEAEDKKTAAARSQRQKDRLSDPGGFSGGAWR